VGEFADEASESNDDESEFGMERNVGGQATAMLIARKTKRSYTYLDHFALPVLSRDVRFRAWNKKARV